MTLHCQRERERERERERGTLEVYLEEGFHLLLLCLQMGGIYEIFLGIRFFLRRKRKIGIRIGISGGYKEQVRVC